MHKVVEKSKIYKQGKRFENILLITLKLKIKIRKRYVDLIIYLFLMQLNAIRTFHVDNQNDLV